MPVHTSISTDWSTRRTPSSLGLTCVAGQPTGGGVVRFGQFAADDDSFFRKAGQLGYNYTLGTNATAIS